MPHFKSDKQRRGFFAGLRKIKEDHRVNVQMRFERKIKREEEELNKIRKELAIQNERTQLRKAQQQQLIDQRTQIANLKKQEREAKAEIFRQTNTGRAVNLLKREAGIISKTAGRGLSATGRGVKKVATSEQTAKVLKKIKKNLF